MTQPDGVGSFGGAVRESVRLVDILALLAVPVALFAVFSLPESTRQVLAFSYREPDLLAAYAANFVHLERGHLALNAGGYLVVASVAYLLSAVSGHRGRFFAAFATILLAFPVALSYLNLAVPRAGSTVGFSGLLMSFVGYLPVAIAGSLRTTFDIESPLDVAGSLFFGGLALIAVLVVPTTVGFGVAAASVLAAALFGLSAVGDGSGDRSPGLGGAVRASGHVELLGAAVVSFVGYTVAAFPLDPVVGGAVVNLYAHLLGYALGFIVMYVTLHAAPVLSRVAGSVGDAASVSA